MAKGQVKRRLSAAFGTKQPSLDLDNTLLEINDDEAERRERRKSKVHVDTESDSDEENNNMSPPKAPPKKIVKGNTIGKQQPSQSLATKTNESFSQLSQIKKSLNNDQLTDLYANCIKLCSENKINTKNTWDLNLIDYIDDVIGVQQQENSEMTNFQVASVTLDASVKIYSCRVDSVHNEAFKVLGGLSRTAGGQDVDEETLEGANGGETTSAGEEANKPKKKTKKISEVGGVNTLDTFENITVKKFDLAFDIDPLFKKTSASFDEGGAKGLLLNHLSVYRNCQIIFDSSDAMEESKKSEDGNGNEEGDKTCNITDLQKKLLNITTSLSGLDICPTFANFTFSRIDNINDEEDFETLDMEPFSDEDIPDATNDVPVMFGAEDVWQTAEANLMEEILSHEEEDDPEKFQDVRKGNSPTRKSNEGPYVIDNEFGYFDPKVLGNWAGPDHWKFSKTKNNEVNQFAESKKTKGKKKDAFFLDFSSEDINTKEAFASGKAATTLSAAIMKKASTNNNLLPPDVHYDIKMLSQLFTKPRWRVSIKKRRKLAQSDKDEENGFGFIKRTKQDEEREFVDETGYGFGDTTNFEDNGAYNGWSDNEGDIVIPAAPEIFEGGIDLLAEPRRVEQIKINYAKTSKFVDVKVLKDTIWQEVEEIPKTPKNNSKRLESKSFQEILTQLPNRISKEILPNISVPFAFICLLHLANEKGLSLDQERNNINSLFIEKE